jgi:hypothetical protein
MAAGSEGKKEEDDDGSSSSTRGAPPAPHTQADSLSQGLSGTMGRDQGSGASSWIGPGTGRGQSLVPVPSQALRSILSYGVTYYSTRTNTHELDGEEAPGEQLKHARAKSVKR